MLTTRRGKQFNSMVYGDYESFNHGGRYDVLMNKEDADRLSIAEGEGVVLHNGFGVFQGVAKYVDILKGNIEVYFLKVTTYYLEVDMRNTLRFQITTLQSK